MISVRRDGDIGLIFRCGPVEVTLDLEQARELYEKLGTVLKDSEARNCAYERRNRSAAKPQGPAVRYVKEGGE